MAQLKKSYLVIPILILLVMLSGGYLTDTGLIWYATINLPKFTPPGSLIGAVWTIIYILTAFSICLVWNGKKDKNFNKIFILFAINAVSNVFWSALFFGLHQPLWAFIDALIIVLTLIFLIPLIWKSKQKEAAILLVPYLGWVTFATYLNYIIWTLN